MDIPISWYKYGNGYTKSLVYILKLIFKYLIYIHFLNIRHIIAAVHFNHNRKVVTNSDGSEQLVVVYPKFKNGEATVRDVKVAVKYVVLEVIFLVDERRAFMLKLQLFLTAG